MNTTSNKLKKPLLNGIIVVILVGIIVYLGNIFSKNPEVQMYLQEWGYLGAFIIALISGFNIVVPIPAVAFVPALVASGLEFWLLILTIAVGVTIVDLLVFHLGKLSRELTKHYKPPHWITKIETYSKKGYVVTAIIVFLWASFIPLPNEVLLIPLAFFGHTVQGLIIPAFLGNITFNTLVGLGLLQL